MIFVAAYKHERAMFYGVKRLKDRLNHALKEAGISQGDLARRIGISQQAISALATKGKGSKHLYKIARELGVRTEWLETGEGEMMAEAGARPPDTSAIINLGDARGNVTPLRRTPVVIPGQLNNLVPVRVIGEVQAGVWREAVEWPAEDNRRREINLPVAPHYQHLQPYALEVIGPSMDQIFSHGSLVVVVPFLNLGREPRQGDKVVALRSRPDGTWEVTVKEFVIKGSKPYLWPRSNHPDFQTPIPVEEPPDGEQLFIQGLVVMSVQHWA